jgi:hypothetical protein
MPTFEITAPDGKVYDITGETQEGALAALKEHLGDTGQEQPASESEADTSGMGAINYGIDNAGKLIGKGIQGFGELTGSDTLQDYGQEMAQRNEQEIADANYQRPEGADGIVKNLREGDFVNAGKSLAYGVAEAAPQMAGGIVASSAAMASSPVIAGGLLLGGTAYGITSAMGENKDEKEEKGLDADATASDLTAAIASGLIEILPVKGGGATLKILKEGAQEVGQEGLVIGNTAVQGGAYVPDEILNRMGDAGIIGSTLAGATNTAITTISKTGDVVFKPRQDLDPEVDQAAGDVARMLKDIASDEGLNLKNIDPTSKKGANTALDTARSKNTTDINTAAEILRKEVLKGADTSTRQRFNQAIKNANTKVGTVVSNEDIKFIKDTVGKTLEGQQLVQSLYKSNVVTELYAAGLKGGFSKFTDNFNPIPQIGKSYDPARSIGTMLNLGAIAGTGGSSLLTQVPLVAGGRAIDAVTGRRSKINRFVKNNRKSTGMSSPVGVAVEGRTDRLKNAQTAANNAKKKAAKAERAKEQAEQNVVKYNEGYAPNYGDPRLNQKPDPRGTVHNALAQKASLGGMSIKEIDTEIQRIIDERLADKRTSKAEKKSLRTYANFNSLGAMPKGDQTLGLAISAIRDRFNFPQSNSSPSTTQTPQQRSPEVQQGIIGNLQKLSELRASMESDMSISNRDKAVMDKALSDLAKDLGSDPQAMIKQIIKDAKADMDQPNKTDRYLKPYLTRVSIQQKKRK